MQVKRTKPQAFEPFSVEITFDTLDDVIAVRKMTKMNIRLPDYVRQNEGLQPEQKGALTEFLTQLDSILCPIVAKGGTD